jgi:N6-L-threonylcarbamoyladenine synthase
MKPIRLLAIETSCDETSVAIVSFSRTGARILHHETATQIPVHERYGGVIPEVAARMHVAETVSLLDRAGVFTAHSSERGTRNSFDAIVVTQGPGLATALRVGIEAARTVSFATGKPLIGVNHLEGHLASAWLMPDNRKNWKFPILSLLVSGGHTELVLIKDFTSYKVIGRTRDDASGEAFDKTAKLMGLGYPGGPVISKLSAQGSPISFDLPRPMMHDKTFDFSFSGLKSAVRRIWQDLPTEKRTDDGVIADMCASVQRAIVDVLISKTIRAAKKYKPTAISIVGGVSANPLLQKMLADAVAAELKGVRMLKPATGLHTDNAAMIAAAGYWRLMKAKKKIPASNWQKVDAKPELDL